MSHCKIFHNLFDDEKYILRKYGLKMLAIQVSLFNFCNCTFHNWSRVLYHCKVVFMETFCHTTSYVAKHKEFF